MTDIQRRITEDQWRRAELIWDYHKMRHDLVPVDVAIGLGSHDLGVAAASADLYRTGLFPVLVFTGGNSPTTRARFPRGEAVHFREHALELGVPDSAILVEPNAANTGQNITLTRDLLAANGLTPKSDRVSEARVRHRPGRSKGRVRRVRIPHARRVHEPSHRLLIHLHQASAAEPEGPAPQRGAGPSGR